MLLASIEPIAMDISVFYIIGINPVDVSLLKAAKLRGLFPSCSNYSM